MDTVKISKYMSFLLRHRPADAGLTLDDHGWCDTVCLLEALQRRFPGIDMAMLEHVVATNNKQRYSFSADKTRIRANQGHTIAVDVDLKQMAPPDVLYHGTASRNADSIGSQGLLRGQRLYVHLSPDTDTAMTVGARHGSPIVYEVDCLRMVRDGYRFYISANGVWQTEHVPAEYLRLLG